MISAGVAAEERFDFGRIERLVEAESMLELTRRLGINPRQVYRWRSYGVQWSRADQMACALGLHPGDIWPEWWEASDDAR